MLFYDNLCARTGVNSGAGDYYHNGDPGGSQYLNACVWFEMITGEDRTALAHRPSYTLTDSDTISFEALVQAAHQAVLDLSARRLPAAASSECQRTRKPSKHKVLKVCGFLS